MSLRVVGAGVGRTGTNSLKLALEQLLGGKCHHMFEVISDPTVQVTAVDECDRGRRGGLVVNAARFWIAG